MYLSHPQSVLLHQLHSTHGEQEAPQFCKSKSKNKSVEMNFSIMLPLPSHNLKRVFHSVRVCISGVGCYPQIPASRYAACAESQPFTYWHYEGWPS